MIIHGWKVFAHKLFLNQLEELTEQVEALHKKDPENYTKKNAAKRLAAIVKLAFDIIPQDPTLSDYRQGKTLGKDHKNWFRAKFFQQYRLFFRYHLEQKVIVYAWINDEKTKRAYGSRRDAYKVFEKMLNTGHPPENWDKLLGQSMSESKRFKRIVSEK